MLIVCPCLNVCLQAFECTQAAAESGPDSPIEEGSLDEFFGHNAYTRVQVLDVTYKLGNTGLQRQTSGHGSSFQFTTCPVCGTPCVASRASPLVHLVSNRMIREPDLETLKSSQGYCEAYGIILPQSPKVDKENVPLSIDTGFNDPVSTGEATDVVTSIAQEYLRKEKEAMEKRIRDYCDKEHVLFDAKKSKVKAQRLQLLKILDSVSNGTDENSRDSGIVSSSVSPGSLSMMDQSSLDFASTNTVGRDPVGVNSANGISKQKHHSGGSVISGTGSQMEGEPLFCIDEDRHHVGQSYSSDEADTDDSGTGFEYHILERVKPMVPGRGRHPATSDRAPSGRKAEDGLNLYIVPEPKEQEIYGRSLPVGIPQKSLNFRDLEFDLEVNVEEEVDIGTKLQMLAESFRESSNPDLLYGSRPPDRRRWRTGVS